MKKFVLAGLLSMMIPLPVSANPDYDYFSAALQLDQRWERISKRTVEKYLQYLEKQGLFTNLALDAKPRIRDEIRAELLSRLTWDKVGDRVVRKVVSGCSDETLRKFSEAYEERGAETDTSAVQEYLGCASEGVSGSMVIIQQEFKEAAPSLERIAKKYRKK